MEHPETFKLTSAYDREFLKRPPKKQYNEDGEEIPLEEDQIPKPLKEKDLVFRPNESVTIMQSIIGNYRDVMKYLYERCIQQLAPSKYINLESSGLTPEEILDSVLAKLSIDVNPIRPLCKKLDSVDDGNLKELLRQNLDEGQPSRRWSAFKAIDPINLSKGRVVVGKGEFACEYASRVFLLENEENQKIFIENPRKFLTKRPEMPKDYAIAILGPRKSGKTTVAKMLEEKYGWKAIEMEQLICEKLKTMKNWTTHVPSNPKVLFFLNLA